MLLAAVTPAVLTLIPDAQPEQPPGTENIATLISWGGWIVLIICVLGLLAYAAALVVNNGRGGTVNWDRLVIIAFAAVMAGGAGGIVGALV